MATGIAGKKMERFGQMKSVAAVFLKYELVLLAIASGLAAIQWQKSGWRSAIFIFVWMFVLLNLPFVWYFTSGLVKDWWRRRR